MLTKKKKKKKKRKKERKKFWEELIAYFLFTEILVSDETNRNETLVCIQNEVSKAILISVRCEL
jgi:hypothetical protein